MTSAIASPWADVSLSQVNSEQDLTIFSDSALAASYQYNGLYILFRQLPVHQIWQNIQAIFHVHNFLSVLCFCFFALYMLAS